MLRYPYIFFTIDKKVNLFYYIDRRQIEDMIKLVCDVCGIEEVTDNTAKAFWWVGGMANGKSNRCEGCNVKWIAMQDELKASVTKFREAKIKELQIKYGIKE